MLNLIDRFLNRITMYRLVLYFLIVLLAAAAVFGAFGLLPYAPLAIVFSSLLLVLVCLAVNAACAKLFGAPVNVESAYITALILALIITPVLPADAAGVGFLVVAGALAMASKYILAIGRKHIFNPAAIAVVITAFTVGQYASWWVGGNLPLLAFVLAGGLLVVRKIQRFDLILTFFAAALASFIITNPSLGAWTTAAKMFTHTPVLFFGFIMLTEPLTTPPVRARRIAYGALVGLLFAPAIHLGSIYSTPELALVLGNIFSYIVSPKWKNSLALKTKQEIGGGIFHFTFVPAAGGGNGVNGGGLPKFQPGQYLEWTLAHGDADTRGNRRSFTIASSPTERDLQLGVRFYESPSSFKRALGAMRPGDVITAAAPAGDFVLPQDARKKLAFIAGGIGITPFRSMIKYLSDRGERRDVVLLYSNRGISSNAIAYRDVFDEAEKTIGLKTIYVTTGGNGTGGGAGNDARRIDAARIAREVPDWRERFFYISGTQAMVSAFQKMLRGMGVPRRRITTDFFPGFS